MKTVGIINLDTGNLLSMKTAVEAAGYVAKIITKPNEEVDALILPGQGRFSFVAGQLDQFNWRSFIKSWVNNNQIFIGVCVGMQVLFDSSNEDPESLGLGLLNGTICRLNHPKTPMVGWAQLNSTETKLDGKFAYFVNSYGVFENKYSTSTVNYGTKFCASVQEQNIFGFQFHPEKSGSFGKELIKSCIQ
jgi:imidazole glycerol phosphate synthase glutamine amidotransferase subunit